MAFDQCLCGLGQLAEAVGQFLAQLGQFHAVACIGQAFVENQPLVHVRAIILRQERRCVQLDFGYARQGGGQVRFAPGFERFHRLLQHVGIERKAHFLHFAGL